MLVNKIIIHPETNGFCSQNLCFKKRMCIFEAVDNRWDQA